MKGKRILIGMIVVGALASTLAVPTLALPETEVVPATGVNTPSPQDVPDTLVSWGVTEYDLIEPKLFWYRRPGCTGPPPPASSPRTSPMQGDYAEEIARIATYGGITRTLYHEAVDPDCADQVLDVLSNIVADDNYIYWMSNAYGGVVRLSTNANEGDPPELFSNAVSGDAELALDDDYVFVLSTGGGRIYRISKINATPYTLVADAGTYPRNLQGDGKYVYWITSGVLKRIHRHSTLILNVATGVTGYYPEGEKLKYCIIDPPQCFYTEYIFIGQGNQVTWYDNITGNSGLIYTSSDPSASVYNLVTDFATMSDPGNLFLFESREIECNPFCIYQDVLIRTGRGGGTGDPLYVSNAGLPGETKIADHLETDLTFLFWRDEDELKRLPNNAAALPQINIEATGMEITQGIQDVFNSVRLIENRRTFVRVRADTDSTSVAGVSARLYRTTAGGQILAGPLLPVNPVGKQITVQPHPNRADINHSFLFELPWGWTTGGPLYLRAEVNPYKYPLEPAYSDNVVTAGPLTFEASPRLQVQFVSFGYFWDGQFYYPRFIEDVLQTYSWIRRAYPLDSTPGSYNDPSPGLRPNHWFVFDDQLGGKVWIDPNCTPDMFKDPATFPQCSNLRASAYTNSLMSAMRAESGIPMNIFMYGLISDGLNFPRGQASSGANVSSGPAGTSCCGCTSWDTDGSCTDWYAGHEIGHTLGRAHPVAGSSTCGHSADDPNFPYFGAKISDGYAFGFDVGDPGLNPDLQLAVYSPFFWYEIMSYCEPLWISDYTYDAMYDYMIANEQRAADSPGPRLQGDFLSVFGDIMPTADTAAIHRLRHLDEVASIPALIPGDYSIRLLDAAGGTLTDYAFTPETIYNTDLPMLSFGQVVSHTAGTAQVQIVRISDSLVLTSQTLSVNPPTISGVALQSPPDPVTGVVTLAWSASDPDGDPLTSDILYSVDNGVTFQPLQMNVSNSSALLDTLPLGGSPTAILRVVASDGVHSAYGDTAPFTMAGKPPQPYILTPANGTQIHWGQLLNFSGEALDLQDGSVSGANLVWSSQYGQLGSGELLSINDLPVGVNYITLAATNSLGLSASTQITVVVDDDLDWPGPTLSVGPAQVGWHVGVEALDPQTAELSISNAGTGDLDWIASEDAPWLSISADSGTVPFTLTLTANPTGMTAGTALSTTLWIVSPESYYHTTQTVAIRVSLLVGDVWRDSPGVISNWIFLPLIVK
jgi:hypothetical protein